MMKSGTRLTWDASFIRPYESAWSVATRVCRLNGLTRFQLARLICKAPQSVNVRATFDVANKDWVNFQKYSQLLGADASSLETGFLGHFGIKQLNRRTHAIKHCEEQLSNVNSSAKNRAIICVCCRAFKAERRCRISG